MKCPKCARYIFKKALTPFQWRLVRFGLFPLRCCWCLHMLPPDALLKDMAAKRTIQPKVAIKPEWGKVAHPSTTMQQALNANRMPD